MGSPIVHARLLCFQKSDSLGPLKEGEVTTMQQIILQPVRLFITHTLKLKHEKFTHAAKLTSVTCVKNMQ